MQCCSTNLVKISVKIADAFFWIIFIKVQAISSTISKCLLNESLV
ncbi:Hypothetical protein LRC_08070 [Ligilactobacillus ruminis ATCC 27782]|uniref:Uncharacterized protein n=1 Tax=Ligilactobacillus ruminis (strain ATCC 27782 / RF3) TaxID=1069534 RepID=G2SNC6_LIGR2|nr:Hypothetical protein LRC_08070 [Ligilactobacillus ruminis ATCC 27782]